MPIGEHYKPSEDVRVLFNKGTYNMDKDDPMLINYDYPKPKPLFEYVGRLDTPGAIQTT